MTSSIVATANRRGWISCDINEIAAQFLEFARGSSSPVLDIGAGQGLVSSLVASIGKPVIANEIESQHIAHLKLAHGLAESRIRFDTRRFPNETEFPLASLGAVHASLVFHFLSPTELTQGLQKIAHWLLPGGRLYAVASSPFVGNFRAFLPIYRERAAAGQLWPAFVDDVEQYATEETREFLPQQVLLIDKESIATCCEAAGLQVEDIWYFRRRHLDLRFVGDGNENVAIIASRPLGSTFFSIASYEGRDRPHGIESLRLAVWQSAGWIDVESRANQNLSKDTDENATHWVVRDAGQIVAAARMHLVNGPEQASWLRRLYPRIPLDGVSWPAAVLSRLVVADSHRRMRLATRLDAIRMERARVAGARSILALANGARAIGLQSQGFGTIGKILPNERHDGLGVDADVLLQRVAANPVAG